MKRTNRFVFDVNVLVSALLFPDSIPDKAVKKGFLNGFVITSEPIFDELTKILYRKKFDKYVTLTVREFFLQSFEILAIFIDVKSDIKACRDPKDDKFLSLAKAGNASAIITSDKDLLILNPFESIQIITPEEFVKLF